MNRVLDGDFAVASPSGEAMRSRRRRFDRHYATGAYWRNRTDLMYYHYVDYILRTAARDATSLIDIGTASCSYLEWFDWIPERFSFDRAKPYSSQTVTGLRGDFMTHDFGRRFDVCTCLQVLEHVDEVETFARKLLALADVVLVSLPYRWGANAAADHLHDPIDYDKLSGWMGRRANYHIVVQEPFRANVGQRLVALYHRNPAKTYGRNEFKDRIRRD